MANEVFKRIGYGQVEPNQLSAIKTGQIYASLPLDPAVSVLQNGQFMYYNYARNMVTADDTTKDGAGAPTMAEPYLVYNEIKIYEDWLSYKDFAMIRQGDNYVTNNPMVGRLTSANTDGTVYGGGANTIGAPVGTPATPGEVTITPAFSGATYGHTEYPYRMDGIAPRLLKTNIGDIFTTNTLAELAEGATDYAVGDTLGFKETGDHTLELTRTDVAGVDTTKMTWIIVKDYTMPDGQRGFKIQRIA